MIQRIVNPLSKEAYILVEWCEPSGTAYSGGVHTRAPGKCSRKGARAPSDDRPPIGIPIALL